MLGKALENPAAARSPGFGPKFSKRTAIDWPWRNQFFFDEYITTFRCEFEYEFLISNKSEEQAWFVKVLNRCSRCIVLLRKFIYFSILCIPCWWEKNSTINTLNIHKDCCAVALLSTAFLYAANKINPPGLFEIFSVVIKLSYFLLFFRMDSALISFVRS